VTCTLSTSSAKFIRKGIAKHGRKGIIPAGACGVRSLLDVSFSGRDGHDICESPLPPGPPAVGSHGMARPLRIEFADPLHHVMSLNQGHAGRVRVLAQPPLARGAGHRRHPIPADREPRTSTATSTRRSEPPLIPSFPILLHLHDLRATLLHGPVQGFVIRTSFDKKTARR